MQTSRDITLGELFTADRGKSKLTRAFLEKHPGEYPVYSAAVSLPLGFTDTFDYQGPVLSFTMNGYGGRVRVIEGKFSINADRGILIPRKQDLPNLTYLQYVIEPVLVGLAVGRRVDGLKNEYTKVSIEMALNATINLPILPDSTWDFARIEEIAARIRRVEELKTNLGTTLDKIDESSVVVECEAPYADIPLGDKKYFKLSIGKRVLMANFKPGGVTAYSASVRKVYGEIQTSNLSEFDRPSLLWGIDWKFDWNYVPPGDIFATTDHCGRAQVVSPLLDPEYLLHQLRATKEEYGFDRVYRANLKNVGNATVRVPLDKTGTPDLERQRLLAARYARIEALRVGTMTALEQVLDTTLDPTE